MSSRDRGLLRWSCGALFLATLATSCEPRKIEIQGLEELTSEIRSQRLLESRRPQAARGTGETIGGKQIEAAMSPLREVLSQLAASQKDLSTRQATLTKEMRQWTHLLVESMQATRKKEASELNERLQALEKTIAAQDARHRQVEELLGKALDHTADQLEAFLRKVGGLPEGATGTQPDENSGAAGNQPKPAAGNGAPGNKQPEGATPTGAVPKPAGGQAQSGGSGESRGEPQQASLRWLWWTLALLSMFSGLLLLRGRRRPEPVAMAPEMQFTPTASPNPLTVDEPPGDEAFATPPVASDVQEALAAAEALAEPCEEPVADTPNPAAPDKETDKETEVEELWAAAALLGEAIGRLKQSGEAVPPGDDIQAIGDLDLSLPTALPVAPQVSGDPEKARDDFELDEMFVIDESDDDIPETEQLPEFGPVDSRPIESRPRESGPADSGPIAAEPAPRTEPPVELPRAEPVRAPAARHASDAPVTCRLQLHGDSQTEGRVRRLLDADPRVLVSPAPRVHNAMGELEVSFALLPGLPAGERSLLEQQLRETGA